MELKPWELVTAAETLKIKRNQCSKCKYASRQNVDSRNLSNMTCDYIFYKKHSRGCSPIDCKMFEPRKKQGRRQAMKLRFKGSGEDYDKGKVESVQGAEKRDKDTG